MACLPQGWEVGGLIPSTNPRQSGRCKMLWQLGEGRTECRRGLASAVLNETPGVFSRSRVTSTSRHLQAPLANALARHFAAVSWLKTQTIFPPRFAHRAET
jgi:hypothetical protein